MMAKKKPTKAVKPSKNGKPQTRAERVAPWLAKAYRPIPSKSDYDFGEFLDSFESLAKETLKKCGAEKWPHKEPKGATEKQKRVIAASHLVLSRIQMMDRALASGSIPIIALTAVDLGRVLRTEDAMVARETISLTDTHLAAVHNLHGTTARREKLKIELDQLRKGEKSFKGIGRLRAHLASLLKCDPKTIERDLIALRCDATDLICR